jgi:DNA-directed RNA polymerase subunit beta
VRDTSLRVPPGVAGIVIGAQVFSAPRRREGRARQRDRRAGDERLRKDQDDETSISARARCCACASCCRARPPPTASGTSAQGSVARHGRRDHQREARQIPQRRWKDVQVADARVQDQIERISRTRRARRRDQGVFDGEDLAPEEGRRAAARASSRWSRCTWPSSASCRSATRWPAATATRA